MPFGDVLKYFDGIQLGIFCFKAHLLELAKMRIKAEKMPVNVGKYLRNFCVNVHLFTVSRHLFSAKWHCPECHCALLALHSVH